MSYFVMNILDNNNQTLYDLLCSFSLSQEKIRHLFNNKQCYINGNIVNADYLMKENDCLCIDTTDYDGNGFEPNDYELNILYEDDYLLIIDKPAKCIIYPDNIIGENTLANYVLNYYLKHDVDRKVRHVHRLDYDTTGCIVYAKDMITQAALSKMIENKTFTRKYLAIVSGKLRIQKGTIKKNIGKDRHVNGKMVISKTGKEAITNYIVKGEKNNTSLVELQLDTGRTHQIRVHLASIGHPLIGDSLYGSQVKMNRVFLHSYYVDFIHPITKKEIVIKANLPLDMREYWYKKSAD